METNNNGNPDSNGFFSFQNLFRGILQQGAQHEHTNTTNQAVTDSSGPQSPLSNSWDDIDRDSDVEMPPLDPPLDGHESASDTSMLDMTPASPVQADAQPAAPQPSLQHQTPPVRASYAQDYNHPFPFESLPSVNRTNNSSMPSLATVSDSEDESLRDARDVEMHLGVVEDDGDSAWTDDSMPPADRAPREDRRHVAVEEVPDPEDVLPATARQSQARESQPPLSRSPPPRPQGPRLPNFGQFFEPRFMPTGPGSGEGQGHGQQPTLPNFADFLASLGRSPNTANPNTQPGNASQPNPHQHGHAPGRPHPDHGHAHPHVHTPHGLAPMITLSFEIGFVPGPGPTEAGGDQAPAQGQEPQQGLQQPIPPGNQPHGVPMGMFGHHRPSMPNQVNVQIVEGHDPHGEPIGATADFNGTGPVLLPIADLFTLLGLPAPVPAGTPNPNVQPRGDAPAANAGEDGAPVPDATNVPNAPTQQDYVRTLLQLFSGLFNYAPPEPERDDPERARRLVAGLEPVSEGLLKRIQRVAKLEGDEENGTGCAVCWEPLIEGDNESTEAPAEWKTEQGSDGDIVMGGPSTATTGSASEQTSSSAPAEHSAISSTPEPTEAEPPLPKIVTLPCSHVFHSACLIPWFSRPRQTTCPTCRFNIDPEGLTRSIRPLPRRTANPAGAVPGPQPQQGAGQPFVNPLPPLAQLFGAAPPEPRAQGPSPAPQHAPGEPAAQAQASRQTTQGPVPASGNAPSNPPPRQPARPTSMFVPLAFGGQGALLAVSPLFAIPPFVAPGMRAGQAGPQPQPQPQPRAQPPPQSQPQAQAQAQPQAQPQQPTGPNAHPPPPATGLPPFFAFPPNFTFQPLNVPPVPPRGSSPATNPASSAREKRTWVPPPAPGPSLRQRVEARERNAGLRCDDVSCGIGPSDEDPTPELLPGVDKMIHIRPRDHEDGAVCAHKFHPACLVVSERVAGWGLDFDDNKEKEGETEVEVSCPVCRAVGVIPREEWEEGACASA